MLFLLISFLPFFVLLSKSRPCSLSLHGQVRSGCFPCCSGKNSLCFAVHYLKNVREASFRVLRMSVKMASKRKCAARVENVEESREMSILDLPDLALECILAKLPPSGLCSMAGVCTSLRDMCRDDHLWETHMREKWGKVIGLAAKRELDWYLASRKESPGVLVERHSAGKHKSSGKPNKWIKSLSWPLSWLKSRLDSGSMINTPLPDNSIMSCYLSLESGKFWFPAQVYNREHGHEGFLLSCYDAELSYDCRTDTFQARYPPHGQRTIVVEDGVQWDRIRAPAVDTPAHDLHISDCLHDLRPGDHIEIQWRRKKEFPYGWWYGIVGHMEQCDGSPHFCRCHQSDSVMLEFNQYAPGSRWRRTTISRMDHREEGYETDGFYGGIRKLYKKDEISTWKQLWPVEVLGEISQLQLLLA